MLALDITLSLSVDVDAVAVGAKAAPCRGGSMWPFTRMVSVGSLLADQRLRYLRSSCSRLSACSGVFRCKGVEWPFADRGVKLPSLSAARAASISAMRCRLFRAAM